MPRMDDPSQHVSQRHIVLIGEMAAGKTVVGRELASQTGRPFRDSDEIVEVAVGQSAAEYAAAEGVEALHALELDAFLEAMGAAPPAVIAPAASVVDHASGRRELKVHQTVWLDAAPHVLAERIESGEHRRVLEAGETEELRHSRRDYFEECSFMKLDTAKASPEECALLIIAGLDSREGL